MRHEDRPRRRVARLPDQVANQIAAGEVVTRPSSVVKELVENAVDAEAASVRVDIDAGGTLLIRVADDGLGMDREDALCALERHATSKLCHTDELHELRTLGFRGEALPSIASVSRFCLQTRTRDATEGVRVEVDGGGAPRVDPCGRAVGTTVEVRELFYNVPARRKFLRAVATESANVTEVVRAAALACPHVRFTLTRDGRRQHEWLPAAERAGRVGDVLSGHRLYQASGARGPVQVTAFLSAPDRARSGAGGLELFVNGRPIGDRALCRAVQSAYGDALERGRYPVGVVYLDLDPALVDVNVHPQKAEVRFAHARAVSDALYSVVHGVMQRELGAVGTRATAPPAHARPRPAEPEEGWQWSPAPAGGSEPVSPVARPGAAGAGAAPPPAGQLDGGGAPPPAGQLDAGRFWTCEHDDGLSILEPDAVERLLVADRLRRALAAGKVASQRLLFPVRLECPEAAAARFEDDRLAHVGFDVRRSGPRHVTLHAVPEPIAPGRAEAAGAFLLATSSDVGSERWIAELCEAALCNTLCEPGFRAEAEVRQRVRQWLALDEPARRVAVVGRVEYPALRRRAR